MNNILASFRELVNIVYEKSHILDKLGTFILFKYISSHNHAMLSQIKIGQFIFLLTLTAFSNGGTVFHE